jgi:ATP-dependent RNA helicase DeaD
MLLRRAAPLRQHCCAREVHAGHWAGIPSFLSSKLEQVGIFSPSRIQELAIPPLVAKQDVALQSVTGSGKTLAYLLPSFGEIDNTSQALQTIVVTPTRELAVQVSAQAKRLARGGSKRRKQNPVIVERAVGRAVPEMLSRLKHNQPHIVVATPQTLCHVLASEALALGSLRTLILDEADSLLTRNNRPYIDELLALPAVAAAQLVCVSATITDEVLQLRPGSMQLVSASAAAQAEAETAAPASSPRYELPEQLRHVSVETQALSASDETRGAHYAGLVARAHAALQPRGTILVFVDMEELAPGILQGLRKRKFRAAALTASLPSDRKARAAVLRQVKSGKLQVLVVSEMAARGMDIPNISTVINLTVPQSSPQYLHRAGRTARLRPQPQLRTSKDNPAPDEAALELRAASPTAESGTVLTFVDEANRDLLEAHQSALDFSIEML